MAKKIIDGFAGELYEAFKRARSDEYFNYAKNNHLEPLWVLLGYQDMPNAEILKAILIKFVCEKGPGGNDTDILLMAFGLLRGYEDERNVGNRRRRCIEYSDYFLGLREENHEILSRDAKDEARCDFLRRISNNLQKKEERLMLKLAIVIEGIPDLSAYMKELDGYIVGKKPHYRAVIKEPRGGLKIRAPKKQPAAAEETAAYGFINPPYTRNRCFIGRDEVIAQIHTNFHSADKPCGFQTISGLGGAGKTQIALEYAYRRSEYDIAVWLDAESRESILSSIYKFVSYLDLGVDKKDLQIVFLQWFQSHTNWLLIYDNVDDYAVIEPFLPKREGAGHILMTSRLSSPYKHGGLIALGVLDDAAAIQFLKRRTGLEEDETAALLAKRLGGLPLALEQAGAYIAENQGISYTEYMRLLEQYDLDLMEEHDGVIDYEKPLTAAWNLSLEKIEMKSAMQLLCICSFFAPNNILVGGFLFAASYGLLPEPLQSDIKDSLRRKKIIRELTRYSLCSAFVEQPVGEQLTMHPLVQQYIRKCLDGDTYYLSLCCYIIDSIYKIRESRKTDFILALYHIFYLMYGGYLTHVETVDRHARCLLGKDNAALARLAKLQFQLGSYFASPQKNDLTATVQDLFERSIDLVKAVYGPRHMNLTYIYRNFAKAKEMIGETEEALHYTGLAESIEREHAGDPAGDSNPAQ